MIAGFTIKIALLLQLAALPSSPLLEGHFFGHVPFENAITLLKSGKLKEAYTILDSENEKLSGSEWKIKANFLSGVLAFRLGLFFRCAESFNITRQSHFLPDYSDLFLARCYAGLKGYKKAIFTLKKFAKKHPFSTQTEAALFDFAKYLVALNRFPDALRELDKFIQKYPESKIRPDAYMLMGQALEKLNRPVDAYDPYRTLYYHYPENPLATDALKRTIVIRRDRSLKIDTTPLYLKKIRVERLMRKRRYKEVIKESRKVIKLLKSSGEVQKMQISLAQALRRVGHKTRASGVLIQFLKKYPQSRRGAKARYILGKIYWNSGKPEKALHLMKAIVRKFPKSGWAARALYVSGRIYEERGKKSLAIEEYGRIVENYSWSPLRGEAVWRTGWIYFNSGKYKRMIALFENSISTVHKLHDKDQFLYWTARGYEKTGDGVKAISIYDKIDTFPFSYYGATAYLRLKELTGNRQSKKISSQKVSSRERRELSEKVNGALKSAETPYREHLLKGVELVQLGLFESASLEFAAAEPAFKGSLEKNMLSGDLYEEANNFNKAYQIRDQVLNAMSKSSIEKLPPDFWRSFFPLSYWNQIATYSRKEGVDPFLVLSVIRQESLYNPRALSSANAMGLMQIIPQTGRRLYNRVIKKGSFDRETLFEPQINLQLGINYLSGLLSRYKNDIVLAVATYNAGPGQVKKWATRYGGIPKDEFIEKIPYPETRRYVKAVLRNYQNYKKLYPEALPGVKTPLPL